MKLHKSLFFTVLAFLPVNLGLHFATKHSYVQGILVDYLIPTIFVQDVLVFATLLAYFFDLTKKRFEDVRLILDNSYVRLAFLFLFVVFLSTVGSSLPQVSFHVFFRTFLYVIFSIYVGFNVNTSTSFLKIVKIFAILSAFLSLLGLAQWLHQGSVFDNYLFFGEQPYSIGTKGINTVNFFDATRVPPYGLFRHPNIFGGFLSISLVWIFALYRRNRYYKLVFVLSSICLFLTFSRTAWFGFIFGLILCVFTEKRAKVHEMYYWLLVVLLVFSSYFGIRYFQGPDMREYHSLYRRSNFIVANEEIIKDNVLFGSGPNTNSALIEGYFYDYNTLRFPQPVHNVFALIMSETGILGLLFYVSLLVFVMRQLIHEHNRFAKILLISLLQLVFLGLFDHYVVTIQQLHLIYWLTLGLGLHYNIRQ